MKFNFKKITSVIATVAMLGSTIAFAAAAYPAPFVNNGASNAAIVVGANAANEDTLAATDLMNSLNAKVTATASTDVTGAGDTYLLEKSSTKLHLGAGILDVVSSSVTDDKLPTLLKAGKYLDSDNNEYDFEQKMTLANATVQMFDDNTYLDQDNNPTVGIMYNSGDPVLNYTLTMTDQPSIAKLPTTDLTMMGKSYYVLGATNTTLTLLDSAERVSLSEGDKKTITVSGKTYEAAISFVGTSGSDNVVKLTVNGQTTNSLKIGETYKLSDGSYVGIRDISLQNYAGGVKTVEFGLGAGKLLITNATEVQINDDSVSRLTGLIDSTGGELYSVKLVWKADGKKFVAPKSDLVMPGFEAVKLTWGGLNYASEEPVIVQKGGDSYMQLKDFPLKDGAATIDIMYSDDNQNLSGVGKDANNVLRTAASKTMVFDADTDQYFVASYSTTTDSESYLLKATNFVKNGNYNQSTIQKYSDGTWSDIKTVKDDGASTVDVGSLTLTINAIDRDGRNINITTNGDKFNTIYTKSGMKFLLPVVNSSTQTATGALCTSAVWLTGQIGVINVTNTTGTLSSLCERSTFNVYYNETDKDGNIAAGDSSYITLGFNSASTPQLEVSAVNADVTPKEVGDSKVYKGFMYSQTATELSWDKSGDQYSAKIINHGGESIAKVYVTAPTVSTVAAGSIQIYKDTEKASFKDKDLIVVGGSCINSAAAMILTNSETPLCGAAFSAKTNVGANQYLVQIAASPYNAGKVAMLVAGYASGDTTNAVAFVKAGTVDTSKNGAIVGPTLK